MILSFPSEIKNKLGYYVYRLIDPRNGETFYIGKGKNDRVFHHIKAQLSADELEAGEDFSSTKIARINEILSEKLEVIHVIQRHGLSSKEAYHVEGALIDAYPGLSNLQGGHGNSDFGAMHVSAIVRKYCAPRLVCRHRIVFFTVRRATVAEFGTLEACRGIWRMNLARAKKAELAMPVMEGIVIDVFRPDRWLEASPQDFPLHVRYDNSENGKKPKRIGFVGGPVAEDIKAQYVNSRLPEDLEKTRTQNPVRYSYT